jgi:hypothetical protein
MGSLQQRHETEILPREDSIVAPRLPRAPGPRRPRRHLMGLGSSAQVLEVSATASVSKSQLSTAGPRRPAAGAPLLLPVLPSVPSVPNRPSRCANHGSDAESRHHPDWVMSIWSASLS